MGAAARVSGRDWSMTGSSRSAIAVLSVTACPAPARPRRPDRTILFVIVLARPCIDGIVAGLVLKPLDACLCLPTVEANLLDAGATVGSAASVRALVDGPVTAMSDFTGHAARHGPNHYACRDPGKHLAHVEIVTMPTCVAVMCLRVGAQMSAEGISPQLARRGRTEGTIPGTGPSHRTHWVERARATGTGLTPLSCRLGAAATPATIARVVGPTLDSSWFATPPSRAGRPRPATVPGSARHSLLPDAPTFREHGSGIAACSYLGVSAAAARPAARLGRVIRAVGSEEPSDTRRARCRPPARPVGRQPGRTVGRRTQRLPPPRGRDLGGRDPHLGQRGAEARQGETGAP